MTARGRNEGRKEGEQLTAIAVVHGGGILLGRSAGGDDVGDWLHIDCGWMDSDEGVVCVC